MIEHRPKPKILGLMTLFIVAACGGGGGGSTSTASPPPPPVVTANAGADQTVAETSVVQLAGSGSDSGGAAVTYEWTQTSGPAVTLSASDAPNPTFAAPDVTIADPRQIGFRLTVANSQGQQGQDDITVTVRSVAFLLFTAVKDTANTREHYAYDVLTDGTARLSGPMDVGGNISEYKISPNGSYVAYLADQDSDELFELYTATTDGSAWQKVSGNMQSDGDVSDFDWAPNSAALVYIADADTDTVDEVYVVNPDGSGRAKTNTPLGAGDGVIAAHWSPDSRYIAYSNINSLEPSALGVNVYDTSLGADARVTAVLGTISGIDHLKWSPDASRLGYVSFAGAGMPSTGLFVVAPDGSGNTAIGTKVSRYDWSPDANFVAYTFRPDSPTPYRLYTVQPDGSSNTRISYNSSSTSRVQGFGWAPDSSRIAFRENPDVGTAFEIFTALPNGTVSARVSETPAIAMRATSLGSGAELWAPNSSKFAWRSEIGDTDLAGVYSADADGAINNLVSLAPAQPGGQLQSFGLWAPDSSALAYTSQQDSTVTVELFVGAANGSLNMKVSGAMISNAAVFDDFSWSP